MECVSVLSAAAPRFDSNLWPLLLHVPPLSVPAFLSLFNHLCQIKLEKDKSVKTVCRLILASQMCLVRSSEFCTHCPFFFASLSLAKILTVIIYSISGSERLSARSFPLTLIESTASRAPPQSVCFHILKVSLINVVWIHKAPPWLPSSSPSLWRS